MRGLLAVAVLLLATANVGAQAPDKVPPGGIADDPTPPGGKPLKLDASPPSELGTHQLGVRARYIFVTKAMLSPFLNANTGTQMNSYSLGLEYIYRKPGKSWDVVTSVDFSWLSVDDGNYLGAGHDPTLDTHYTQFRNLSFISADVSIIGWHKFLPWLELRYGGGLGIGYVPGDVLITTNGHAVHRRQRQRPDARAIRPSPARSSASRRRRKKRRCRRSMNGGTDTNVTPHRHYGDKPPVMGVLNLLVGLRFYPTEHLAINWEIGFRDAMFTGLSARTTCSEGRAAFAPRRRASSPSRRRSARRAGWLNLREAPTSSFHSCGVICFVRSSSGRPAGRAASTTAGAWKTRSFMRTSEPPRTSRSTTRPSSRRSTASAAAASTGRGGCSAAA